MKRYCKNIDISDISLIKRSILECLSDKKNRKDVWKLFSEVSGLKENEIYYIAWRIDKNISYSSISFIINWVADVLKNEIKKHKLNLKPIKYERKKDKSNGKLRNIGTQNVKQQIYDYIAVNAMGSFCKRIGEYQCASVRNRGQIYGAKAIQRWMRNKKITYYAKLDIRKCYESIQHDKLMFFLKKYIANDELLWLIESLLDTFQSGLSIGSYLSQFLCNLYLSQLYHEISENMYVIRDCKNKELKRINLVEHTLFYMDDIFLASTNKKYIHKAIKMIIKYASENMGLTIKENWFVRKMPSSRKGNDNIFIDMMGFRIYRWHITIRRSVFKRIRRSYMRCLRKIKMHYKIPVQLARRCFSYYGFLVNTNSFKFITKYKVNKVFYASVKVVRINNEIAFY